MDPATRATDADLDRKFERFAAPLLGGKATQAPQALWGIETRTTARELVAAFCRDAKS